MAVALAPKERNYFSNSALRRSHSQPKFVTRQSSGFHESSSASRVHDIYSPTVKIFSDSPPSSAPSSPRTAHASTADLSCSSTPASNLSLSTDCIEPGRDDDEDLLFPDYNGFSHTPEELEPPPSPRAGGSYPVSPGNDTSTSASRPGTPEEFDYGHSVDDTALASQPEHHVDYLSHNWKEEDIWSSWKYIISNRNDFGNAARLENASWRTWIKAKNKLKTVSPETLNWLKDCDVTWLYGPLQPGHRMISSQTEMSSTTLSKSSSFIQSQGKKKPILKKRSMSEVMLQKSLSSSSLVKQAAAAVQAQQKELPRGIRTSMRPRFERAATDYVTFPFSSRGMGGDYMSAVSSTSSSGMESPSSERKHIHFNEQVEQCIAVYIKGDDDDDVDSDRYNYDSDSDDGGVMMKRTNSKSRHPILKKRSSHNDKADKKSINMLPPTTLKYQDMAEPDSAMKHSVFRSPVLSPSSSQETLRPAKKSGKFFFDEDDDEDEDEDDHRSSSGLQSPPPSSFAGGSSGFRRSASTSSLNADPPGMRRTESGMFMPYVEGEPAATSDGIFGVVLDTKKKASQSLGLPRSSRR